MDGVAQQESEVMRALSELIGHSVHIHLLLLAYSWALRENPGVEVGLIYLCPKIWGQLMKSNWNQKVRQEPSFFFLQKQLTTFAEGTTFCTVKC